MSEKLKEKIREVEDQHFGAIEKARIEEFDKHFIAEAHKFSGALAAVTSIARSLSSKMIEGLMEVEEKKYYAVWGFERFVDYLNSDEVPDLSKSKYYELKELLLSEGPQVFDVFSGKKIIPLKTRKLLAGSGVKIELDGDDLLIADQRVAVTDRAAIKELVETMHDVLRERDIREEKQAKRIATQTEQIQRGQTEYEELQRNLDALNQGDPFDRAFMKVLDGFVLLTREAEKLKPAARAEKSGVTMRSLWGQFLHLKKALGSTFDFEDSPTSTHGAKGAISDRTRQILAEDDDFGDEEV